VISRILLVPVVFLATCLCSTVTGKTIYVDTDAPGPVNDGSSWTNAYKYLQDALAVASSGDEICVAEGTYKPDQTSIAPSGSGDRDATFRLKNGVRIHGGYAGCGKPDPNARDTNIYKTILSGDLLGDDDDFANNDENSYHVVTGSRRNATAVLYGFTITGGNANGPSYVDYLGGGMLNYEQGRPKVSNCTFSGNSAGIGGGGMHNEDSSPTVSNCKFSRNSALFGGGMLNCYYSSPTVANSTFNINSAFYEGGGMCNYNSSPTVTNCTFNINSAFYKGGGMCNYNSSPTVTNCILWGGTIYNDGTSSANITYSDVQYDDGIVYPGTDNINEDPCFVDADGSDDVPGTEDENLRLSPGSPCIDVGDNVAVPADVITDLDSRDRIIDGDCNDTEIVDMGAYEFGWAYIGDFEGEYDVDFFDYSIFASAWLTQDGDEKYDADCDISIPADGYIDMFDLTVFIDNWLAGTGN